MKLDALAGNAALKAQLSAQADSRGLSHAYLIAGPAGSGKATLASLLAAAMVCTGAGDKPCGVCPACKKALRGIHPDITQVDIPQGKREILVDQARQMRADAFIRPNEAGRKVYIIHNAQAMRTEAQNAILKLLEEGPSYAAFLLLTENPGALLPTIRSRCELLSLTQAQAVPREGPAYDAALELLGLLTQGDELALAAWATGLERWEREALDQLFLQATGLLRDALTGAPNAPAQVRAASALPGARLLRAIQILDQLHRATRFNVGAGHLCGALCAKLSQVFF